MSPPQTGSIIYMRNTNMSANTNTIVTLRCVCAASLQRSRCTASTKMFVCSQTSFCSEDMLVCSTSILAFTQPLPAVQSPCIRNCCLDNKDMCLGCFRMLDEILIWSTASSARQFDIVQACAARKQKNAQGDLG